MSDILSKIYDTLSASTALTALVESKIYPEHAYQPDSTPYVVYYSSPGGERVNSLTGFDGLENPIIEVTAYATAIDDRIDISNQVISAIVNSTRFSAILPDTPFDDYDEDTRVYETTMQFSVWNHTT